MKKHRTKHSAPPDNFPTAGGSYTRHNGRYVSTASRTAARAKAGKPSSPPTKTAE